MLSDTVTVDIPVPPIRGAIPVADVTVAPGSVPGEVWLGTVQNGTMLLQDGKIAQPFPHDKAGVAIRVIRKDRGFDPASAGAGNGLANMRNRAQLARVDLTIDSAPGDGNRVTLFMKLNPNHN